MNFTELISRRGQFLNGITESLITLRRKYHGIKGIRWSIEIHRYSEIEFYEMMNKIKEPEKLADYIHLPFTD